MNTLILRITTLPDANAGRAIYGLGDLPEKGIYKAMMHLQHQHNGTEFLPLHQHRIVAISAIQVTAGSIQIKTLGEQEQSEAALLSRLAELVDTASSIVFWNAQGFDLPVINYRLLQHGIVCPTLSRQAAMPSADPKLVDLQAVLSANNSSAHAPFRELVQVLGLPEGAAWSGEDILKHYQAGNVQGIFQACDTEVCNVYLIYLRLQYIQGLISQGAYQAAQLQLKSQLFTASSHLKQFATACWAEQQ